MSKLAVGFAGPWRAVAVLGVTQILAWGTMFYTPVLMLPRLAADRGFTATLAMAGFSAGLLVARCVARYVGRPVDRYGRRRPLRPRAPFARRRRPAAARSRRPLGDACPSVGVGRRQPRASST